MLANSWLNVPATTDIVFDMPFTDRWAAAAQAIGIDLSRMSPDAGHA
jgi:putative transcriptional regulator